MSKKECPLVSIAIITYNQREFLEECIESCLAQDYPNIQIVIADDASTDGTVDILNKYATNPIVKVLFSERNKGLSANCNMAWRECSGEWIKTIAGDDKLDEKCISKYLLHLKTVCFDVCFADMIVFDEDGNKYRKESDKLFFALSNRDKVEYLFRRNYLLAPTSFISNEILQSVGYANEQFPMIEDHPLWLKMAKFGAKFSYLNNATVYYRKGETLSQCGRGIANLKFIESYYKFQCIEVWTDLSNKMLLKKVDDFASFHTKRIGIKYFNNERNLRYKLLLFLTAPLRIYSLARMVSKRFKK